MKLQLQNEIGLWNAEQYNRTLAQIDEEFKERSVNVIWFGADPTGNTDSSGAIELAINSINGGIVYFPNGRYTISRPILIKRGIILKGSTTDSSSIYLANGANCPMLLTPRANGGTATHFMGIENLIFNGNADNQTIENIGVQFWGVYVGSYIKESFITNVRGPGLSLAYGSDITIDDVWVSFCFTDNYAIEFNKNLTSGQEGIVNIKGLYVENIMPFAVAKKEDWNSRTNQTQRGKGVLLHRVNNLKIDKIHMEALSYGLDIANCLAITIGPASVAHMGRDDYSDTAFIRLLDAGTRAISVGTSNATNITNNFSFFKKATGVISNDFHDLGPKGFVHGINIGRGDNYIYSSYTEFINYIALRKVGSVAEQMYRLYTDETGTSYSGVFANPTQMGLGSSVNQTNGSFKKFLRLHLTGSTADKIELSDPLKLPNLGNNIQIEDLLLYVLSNRLVFTYNGQPHNIVSVTDGNGKPSSNPNFIGQIYLDNLNRAMYIATGTGNTGEWRKFVGADMTGNGPPTAIIPEFVGQQYVDKTNRKIYISTGLNSTEWRIMQIGT